nr:MazG nucleotide pyrophosphohydrolase domain-containing protein [Allorhizocola rhizosphaerae]
MQERLHESVRAIGGYWRPLAAVARLLEEIGELAEAMSADETAICSEMADLWIISTCLASQYCIEVEDPAPLTGRVAGAAERLDELVVVAGGVARAVNYYDGPKTPRNLDGWQPLRILLPAFHRVLAGLAECRGVDLVRAVGVKLEGMVAVDSGRFAAQYDPSIASSLDAFAGSLPSGGGGLKRLWGAPDWDPDSLTRHNAEVAAPHVYSFARCARHEGLDGFVVAIAGDGGADQRLAELVEWLATLDTSRRCVAHRRPGSAAWRLSHPGGDLCASVVVGAGGEGFLLFQPADGF